MLKLEFTGQLLSLGVETTEVVAWLMQKQTVGCAKK
jgi:hypothetical protein